MIGDYAFYFCNNLTSVFIGCDVSYIGKAAFCSCIVYCSPTTPPSVYYSNLYPCFASNTKIYVPRSAYNEYTKFTYSYSSGYTYTTQSNWDCYDSYIEPYDFE